MKSDGGMTVPSNFTDLLLDVDVDVDVDAECCEDAAERRLGDGPNLT